MPAKTNLQTAIMAFALAVILFFSPLSAGLALRGWLPPYFLAPFMLVINILGLAPWMVCLAVGAGALAAIGAWFVARRRWLWLLLAAGLLMMFSFPLLYRYQPAVLAASGHELILVTAPGSFCEDVRRRAEVYWEIQPCEYELIGWDEDETLFYRERCKGAPERLWAYNPDARTGPAPVTKTSDTLYPIVSLPQAIDFVRADVYPPSAEESVRQLSFPRPWSVSPTGRWVAAVSRHIYGPEDVVIVSTQ